MTTDDTRPLDRFHRAYYRVHSAYDGECEHGFGPPATRCPNEDCPDRELAEAWSDLDAERARYAALVAAARLWVDYWTAQEAMPWDPAMTGGALHLMVRQFRAALDGGEPR
jgi:hypothetical protein